MTPESLGRPPPPMHDYEKLGIFYLGRTYEHRQQSSVGLPLLYDAKDLTTHAVIVGMTGSGKTGLGVTLLEEAAIDGIPSIVVDPKGDMGNLLLRFPDLKPADFEPWVDRGEASRQGLTPTEYAVEMAQAWTRGLSEWGQAPDRIARLDAAAESVIYTPGSDAGIPLTVLKTLTAPSAAVLENADALQARIATAVSGLLTLLGIAADPLKSREHILLSNILDHAWREGRNLDLPHLIRAVQAPPMQKIGIMDLEAIFPASDRLELAMTINNLLASPGFSAWMQGEPLDIQRMLYTSQGKPRMAVVSIAHLSDQERMFFVTILLNELIAWMRSQAGTSSLRALLYMDEVFGYLPPTANPPSKLPLLTLLKQARAFGLGLVLATQNPVDLDYKALSNAGTWFLGRLQTERDKMRVLDGLEGATASAGAAFDRKRIEQILSGVKSRVFLLNNVHEDEPVVFQTRWALSYLRGPLTREQIQRLMQTRKATHAPAAEPAAEDRGGVPPIDRPRAEAAAEPAPVVSPEIPQKYAAVAARFVQSATLVYRPGLLATGRLHFVDRKSKTDHWQQIARICLVTKSEMPRDPWDESDGYPADQIAIDREPYSGVRFADLPSQATRKKQYDAWTRSLKTYLYRSARLTLFHCAALKLYSRPEQGEGDFRVALNDDAREQRDLAVEKLRRKYATRMERLQERLRKAEQRVEVEAEQAQSATLSAAVSFGSSVLGALFGRKLRSVTNVTRAAGSVKAAGRAAAQRSDIQRAKENVQAIEEDIEELSGKLQSEIDELFASYSGDELEIQAHEIKPRKSDIAVDPVALLWLPYTVDETGIAEVAWDQTR